MIYKFSFINETDKLDILNNNKDKYLLEEQILLDGKYLIFSDMPTMEILQQEQAVKISIFEQQNSQLETALVELASIIGGA